MEARLGKTGFDFNLGLLSGIKMFFDVLSALFLWSFLTDLKTSNGLLSLELVGLGIFLVLAGGTNLVLFDELSSLIFFESRDIVIPESEDSGSFFTAMDPALQDDTSWIAEGWASPLLLFEVPTNFIISLRDIILI